MEVIPEQRTRSLIAKNERFKKRQERWKKKGFKRLIHTWMEKNGEKAIVYNTEEGKRKGRRKKKEKTGRIVYFQVRTLEHVR